MTKHTRSGPRLGNGAPVYLMLMGSIKLISLLALNGRRISEATGADIEHLGPERGHRTLTITRKGGKVVTVPLASRTPGRSA
jgi:integrase